MEGPTKACEIMYLPDHQVGADHEEAQQRQQVQQLHRRLQALSQVVQRQVGCRLLQAAVQLLRRC